MPFYHLLKLKACLALFWLQKGCHGYTCYCILPIKMSDNEVLWFNVQSVPAPRPYIHLPILFYQSLAVMEQIHNDALQILQIRIHVQYKGTCMYWPVICTLSACYWFVCETQSVCSVIHNTKHNAAMSKIAPAVWIVYINP